MCVAILSTTRRLNGFGDTIKTTTLQQIALLHWAEYQTELAPAVTTNLKARTMSETTAAFLYGLAIGINVWWVVGLALVVVAELKEYVTQKGGGE